MGGEIGPTLGAGGIQCFWNFEPNRADGAAFWRRTKGARIL